MREQTTRLITLIVLLLCGAVAGLWQWQPVEAAPQYDQVISVYFPIVHIWAQQPTSDLQIVHLGLYQSVQNHSNGVTLIANKPALLRVYAQSSQTESGSSAQVTIDAYHNGQQIGSLVVGPQPVSTQPTADDMDSTFNFDLPTEWLTGEVTFRATIDKVDAVAELNEVNNTRESTFEFHDVPALNLTIVPITYIDTITGITFSEPGHDPVSQWMLSAFPISEIDVAIHSPFIFTGNLRQGEEWGRLLEDLTTLWAAEAGPGSSQIYYGLVPNTSIGGQGWFEGGVSGLGWIGQRVSLGLDVGLETGESAGHEIGHNLGRRHAPCGNPSGVDPHFPYPNALIGVYGVDTTDETLIDPAMTHDMMSYCGPEWVSDYTYEGLFQDQSLRGDRTGVKGAGLLIRAAVEGDKIVPLPVYQINQPFLPADRDSGYKVQLLDERGDILGIYPAELYEAEETGVTKQMIMAYVPFPSNGARVSKVQFLTGGVVSAERSVADVTELK